MPSFKPKTDAGRRILARINKAEQLRVEGIREVEETISNTNYLVRKAVKKAIADSRSRK